MADKAQKNKPCLICSQAIKSKGSSANSPTVSEVKTTNEDSRATVHEKNGSETAQVCCEHKNGSENWNKKEEETKPSIVKVCVKVGRLCVKCKLLSSGKYTTGVTEDGVPLVEIDTVEPDLEDFVVVEKPDFSTDAGPEIKDCRNSITQEEKTSGSWIASSKLVPTGKTDFEICANEGCTRPILVEEPDLSTDAESSFEHCVDSAPKATGSIDCEDLAVTASKGTKYPPLPRLQSANDNNVAESNSDLSCTRPQCKTHRDTSPEAAGNHQDAGEVQCDTVSESANGLEVDHAESCSVSDDQGPPRMSCFMLNENNFPPIKLVPLEGDRSPKYIDEKTNRPSRTWIFFGEIIAKCDPSDSESRDMILVHDKNGEEVEIHFLIEGEQNCRDYDCIMNNWWVNIVSWTICIICPFKKIINDRQVIEVSDLSKFKVLSCPFRKLLRECKNRDGVNCDNSQNCKKQDRSVACLYCNYAKFCSSSCLATECYSAHREICHVIGNEYVKLQSYDYSVYLERFDLLDMKEFQFKLPEDFKESCQKEESGHKEGCVEGQGSEEGKGSKGGSASDEAQDCKVDPTSDVVKDFEVDPPSDVVKDFEVVQVSDKGQESDEIQETLEYKYTIEYEDSDEFHYSDEFQHSDDTKESEEVESDKKLECADAQEPDEV